MAVKDSVKRPHDSFDARDQRTLRTMRRPDLVSSH